MSNSFNERSVPQKYRRELIILKKKENLIIEDEDVIIFKKSKYKKLKETVISKPKTKNNSKIRYSKSRITRDFSIEYSDEN